MKNIFRMIFLLSIVVLLGACQAKQIEKKMADKQETTTSEIHHKKINYDEQEDWEFTSGKMQSPINIKTTQVEVMSPDNGIISLNYSQDIAKVENNGHSIQVIDGGTATINGRNFELTQFHFHAQSEHTVDGKHYPIEAHFVNTSQSGRIAVIAVFFKEGTENKGFQEVLDDVNNKKTNSITDINDMIPTNKSYYHYLGSLSTPPLNENVEWYVMKKPVEVSKKQIESFKKLYSHNNRNIQPLNDRVILEHNEVK